MELVEKSTEARTGGGPVVVEAPPAPPKRRKRWIALLVVFALLAGAGAYGVRYYLHARLWQSTDDANIEGHVVPISPRVAGQVVDVLIKDNQVVKQGDLLVQIDPRDYEAKVLAARASLTAAVAKRGAAEANIKLIETTSTAAIAREKAGVAVAESAVVAAETQVVATRSALEQAKAQVAAAEAAVSESKADVTVAESDVTRTVADLKRYNAVRDSAAVSKQQIDLIEATARSAKAKLSAAKEKVTAMESQVAAARATEPVAATIRQAETAPWDSPRPRLAKPRPSSPRHSRPRSRSPSARPKPRRPTRKSSWPTRSSSRRSFSFPIHTIKAPRSGRVTRKSVEKGAYVQVGQSLFAIVTPDTWVVANFKETQLTEHEARTGGRVPGRRLPRPCSRGRVDSIQSGTGARFSLLPPENATGNFVKIVQRVPVKIVFEEDEHRLLARNVA